MVHKDPKPQVCQAGSRRQRDVSGYQPAEGSNGERNNQVRINGSVNQTEIITCLQIESEWNNRQDERFDQISCTHLRILSHRPTERRFRFGVGHGRLYVERRLQLIA